MPTEKKLSKLLEEGMLFWEVIDPVWDALAGDERGKVFLATFARVHRAQGLLTAAQWCRTEVNNGGFHQFFLNGTGVLAPEAILGFKSLFFR